MPNRKTSYANTHSTVCHDAKHCMQPPAASLRIMSPAVASQLTFVLQQSRFLVNNIKITICQNEKSGVTGVILMLKHIFVAKRLNDLIKSIQWEKE